MQLPKNRSLNLRTLLGFCGVFMWALGPLLNSELTNLPTFEILSCVFTISFTFSIIKLSINKQWDQIKQPLLIWLIGIAGIFGNDFFYIQAFKFIPPAHVELINHLWPVLVIMGSGFLPKENFSINKVLACLIGFTAVYILINGSGALHIASDAPWTGYSLAFLAASTWATYTLLARHFARIPVEMVGMYFGVSMLLSLLAHYHNEITIIPTGKQMIVLLIMGVTTHGLAYWLWDIGIKKGNFQHLNILSYANPIIAVLLLFIFGKSALTWNIAIAVTLVVFAAIIGSDTCSWQTLQQRWQHYRNSNTMSAYLKNLTFS